MRPRKSPIPDDIFDLTIDSLSYHGGRGVGRHQGQVVFVPGTAPLDKVQVRIVNRKARFCEAEVIKVIEPSPHRRKAPCPVAERCGGCSWQHVDYATQVAQKQQILKMSLRGLQKFGPFAIKDFVPTRDEFNYRNRIQLQVQNGKLGFFAKRSNDLVEVEQCLISEPQLNQTLQRLKPEDFAAHRRIELAILTSGEVRVLEGARDPEMALFSQVNTAQNEVLRQLVVQAVEGKPAWIMDLYAGAGNLTGPLATAFAQAELMAVELSRANVELGKKQITAQWTASDVARFLKNEARRETPGLVVLDPPRVGAEKDVVEQLLRLMPKQIVYVSCNPSTFARDAEKLLAGGAYRLQSVQGLDMFPQTEHVELVASLCAAT